jgi:hypothetical protein
MYVTFLIFLVSWLINNSPANKINMITVRNSSKSESFLLQILTYFIYIYIYLYIFVSKNDSLYLRFKKTLCIYIKKKTYLMKYKYKQVAKTKRYVQ